MIKHLASKLRQNRAYTLTEMIIVVAIVVILLGISFVGITGLMTSLKMTELDDHAKVIYLEAQNQLGIIEVEGALGAYHKQIREAYPSDGENSNLRFLKEIYSGDEKPSDYPEDAETMWEQMCYLKRSDALCAKLISKKSDIYINGGSYLIEFNAQTGDIYGVFYWESNDELTYDDVLNLDSRERRDRTDARIGYYGGEVSGDLSKDTVLGQTTQLINGEELYLKISFPKSAELVQFYSTALDIDLTITGENGKIVKMEDVELNNVVETLDTIEFYVLLDSTHEGYHFDDIVNKGLEDGDKILPGENIEIQIESHFNHESGRWSEKETVEGNSLFGNDTDADTLGITSVRHMMNLNEEYYNGEEYLNAGKADQFKKDIEFFDDVDFSEKANSWAVDAAGNPYFVGYGNATQVFDTMEPIENDALFDNIKIDGGDCVLRNFNISATEDNAGIFKQTSHVKFEDLYIEDITVDASGCDNVGGLVGYMKSGSIENCGVYLSTSGVVNGLEIDYCKTMDTDASCTDGHANKMDHNYDTFTIKGDNNVGGLVGYVEGCADGCSVCVHGSETLINSSFAAIQVEGAGSNVGGLIGAINNAEGNKDVTIQKSYASGDVSGTTNTGGFIGSVSASEKNVIVTDNYATGDVYADQYFGGFIGSSEEAKYTDCISYGQVYDSVVLEGGKDVLKENDYVGGFIYEGSSNGDTFENCVYMVQNGYNTEDALSDPNTIATKKYTELLTGSISANQSYPYDDDLYMSAFPFATLEGQTEHYGNWPGAFVIDTSLVYYERYESGAYGYYCVSMIADSSNVWILDTLKDEACVEDGYGLLSKYNLDKISYELYVGNEGKDGDDTVPTLAQTDASVIIKDLIEEGDSIDGKFIRLSRLKDLNFYAYDSYDEVKGKEGTKTGESFTVNNLYLYQLPYELQCTARGGVEYFYDRIKFTATAQGSDKKVIDGVNYLYCPHFAKTAVNPNVNREEPIADDKYPEVYINPENVFVRSARQLNALGRFPYYWNEREGFLGGKKATYIQETDINFSTYVKTYAGRPFDLQAFGEEYSNCPIGESYGIPFKNIYDGRSNKIVDYCLDGGLTTHFTGLFGEIKNATLKNIVMVVSSNPTHENAGMITSSYKTQHYGAGSDDKMKRENRAGLGALLGMANIDEGYNTIENCVASGYTVKYVLTEGSYQSLDTVLKHDNGDLLDPLGIAVGGLIGYSTDDISNCAAVNDVVIELKKDYQNTYDNYINRAGSNYGDYGTGGVVYLGGFIGSFYYGKIENCYSGGTIDVINNGYSIPKLRVAGFCPGWMDTPMCGNWFRHFNVKYENIYSYTKVSERVWGVPGKKEWDKTNKVFTNNYSYTFTHYIPLVSRLVDYYEIGTVNAEYWLHDIVLADSNVTFNNNFYLDTVTDVHLNKIEALGDNGTQIKQLYADAATKVTCDALEEYAITNNSTVTVDGKGTHTYLYGDFDGSGNLISATEAYPYPAVIYEVDKDGNPTDTKVHYGSWDASISYESALVYYEKYEDGSYGYYSVGSGSQSGKVWILDTLKDRVCVEDGYGILTQYELDSLKYKKEPEANYSVSTLDKHNAESTLKFTEYERYDEILGKGEGKIRERIVANLFKYLYKLPYELMDAQRKGPSTFYDRIRITAEAEGETVINEKLYWFNPNFAKAAINFVEDRYGDLRRPTNVYVRSARQLNALGRSSYYWQLTGNSGEKVTYVQETDINFSTYVKKYLGHEFDLQAFGEDYSNHVIGDATIGIAFRNIYDGQSYQIIDYCVDGGEETWFTGFFGEINGATLKNIVMTVSSKPTNPNAGLITSSFRTKIGSVRDTGLEEFLTGVGALVGHVNRYLSDVGREDCALSTIDNCITSGYKVQYVLRNKQDMPPVNSVYISRPDLHCEKPVEPLGIAIGGFVGFSEGQITNCAAVNTVEIVLEKHYQNTYDNYVLEAHGTGGVVYMGGFVGSHLSAKVVNCYSGGKVEVLNNGFRIPQLRVGSFCPGWLDTPVFGTTFIDEVSKKYRNREFENIYSYTEISQEIWNVPSTSTYYVPLASLLADYYEHDVNVEYKTEKWYHACNYPGANDSFKNMYYLKELSEVHLTHMSDNGTPVTEYFQPFGVTQITVDELKNKANVHVANGRTYLKADKQASMEYPYQAVIKDVKTGEYVHYGPWIIPLTENSPIARYPVYFEEHKDEYGFWYVDENGEVHSNLATVNTTPILNAGYGYLTIFKDEANVPDASIEIENAQNQKMTYYLYKMDDAALNTAFVNSGCQANRYMTFNMEYTRGEVVLGPDVELTAGTQTLCLNPYYGAALCAYDSNDNSKNLGTTTNPLQVRTKEQFENLRYTTESAYIKQTHDVDLKYSNTPTVVNNSVLFDGSFSDEGCVIKNAGDALFETNNGEIKNVRVVSFDSTQASKDTVAGFVLENNNVIRDCSIAGTTVEEQVVIQGVNAYGFAGQNTNLIENCSVAATVNATSEAVGFVDINTGRVINCTVTDTVIEAAEAFGFAEKNQGGGTITDCTATVRIEASNKAAGFIKQNESTLVNSTVYLADSNTDVAIYARKAHGFVETNFATISNCHVIPLGKATIVGVTEADGFARENTKSISNCSVVADVIATGDSSADACGFIRYNKGSISNCHVSDKANAEMMNIKGVHSYGFAKENGEEDANNSSVKIENCSVVANLTTIREYFAWNNSDASYGFVGTNWGHVEACQVGDDTDTEGKVEILIQGSRAFGFIRENRGTITGCSVVGTGKTSIITTATPNATGNLEDEDPDRGIAIGFVAENFGTVENSNVSAMNGYDTILIQGEQAVGFIHRNREATASITGCNVEATVVSVADAEEELFAAGFVLSNSGKITNCSVKGEIIATDIAAGFVKTNRDSIDNCHVYAEWIQGKLAYGFARQNATEDNKAATITNCDVHAKNDYSDIIIRGSERAYGFIGTNWGTVKYCFAVATAEGEITAAGFVAINENTINNCYSNAIVSVSSTNREAYAGGFARLNIGTIEDSYACGTVTGYNTYGFTNSLGTVTNSYTIVDQDGTNMYGFSSSGTPTGSYWGYEGYFNHNAKVARAEYLAANKNESKITGYKLSKFDDAAVDSVAYSFSDYLKNNKYPYETYGMTHYGDWPLPAHFYQDMNGLDWLRAGIYYGEEYQDAVTGERYYGAYAEGDYFYRPDPDKVKVGYRVIGQTINTLMKGDPEDIRKAYNYRCYYGVYYNMDIAAPDWKVNWKFVENGVESAVGTPSPNGIFNNLTEGYVPPNFDTYKFCELKDITDAVLNGTDVKAMATIFYKTNTYGADHTDTNYDYGKFYYEDKTMIDATNGVTLTITIDEVEAARNPVVMP